MMILISIGVCGCMDNHNSELKVENMKNYAQSKYGYEFTVEYFQEAKDETYTNILSLSDGEHIFNVYQGGDHEPSDDYPMIIASKKMVDTLKKTENLGYDIYGYFMFSNLNAKSLDYIKESDAETIHNDNKLLKTIVIVRVDDDLSKCSEALFDIYKGIMAYNPKYIDFEVIQTCDVSAELRDTLSNIPALYDNTWDKYPEIKTYLSVTDTNISSSVELINGGK